MHGRVIALPYECHTAAPPNWEVSVVSKERTVRNSRVRREAVLCKRDDGLKELRPGQ